MAFVFLLYYWGHIVECSSIFELQIFLVLNLNETIMFAGLSRII